MLPLLFALACTDPGKASIKPGTDPVDDTAGPGDSDEPDIDTDDSAGGDTNDEEDSADPEDSGDSGDPLPTGIYERCFSSFMSPDYPLPDYDATGAVVGSHCSGTNHQDIGNIERVVFLGDSVTLGSPPTPQELWYRNVLAETLAAAYGLEEPDWLWTGVDIINGKPLVQDSGDFGVCAKWGGRTDDLMRDNDQVLDCLPEDQRDKATLVVITSGGNDVFKAIQSVQEGEDPAVIEARYTEWVGLMRETLVWLTEDPSRFPGGLYVIFANVYEYTDGTWDLGSCPGAELVGFGSVDTSFIDPLTQRAMGDYLQMAVDTGTDMLFLREGFCGHGYNADDPSAPCHRGAGSALYFDETCIHPNAAGHAAIAQMVLDVIEE